MLLMTTFSNEYNTFSVGEWWLKTALTLHVCTEFFIYYSTPKPIKGPLKCYITLRGWECSVQGLYAISPFTKVYNRTF